MNHEPETIFEPLCGSNISLTITSRTSDGFSRVFKSEVKVLIISNKFSNLWNSEALKPGYGWKKTFENGHYKHVGRVPNDSLIQTTEEYIHIFYSSKKVNTANVILWVSGIENSNIMIYRWKEHNILKCFKYFKNTV